MVSIGEIYGRYTVISIEPPHTRRRAICKCECGNERRVLTFTLQNGKAQSCGCSRITHGEKKNRTRLYRIWVSMKGRCRNPRNQAFGNYGGRGISVCDEWVSDYTQFRDWATSSGYSRELQIDRINNDGRYEPANCRWVTLKTNANNKRNNIRLSAFGEIKTASQWSEDAACQVNAATIRRRIANDWSPEKAIKTPHERQH